MKKQLFELIKTTPLPWDYILYIIHLRKMISIQANFERDNFIKIWIGFIGTMPALGFLIPLFTDFNIVEAINGYQFFLFLLCITLPICVSYTFSIYSIIFFKQKKSFKNILAVYMQIIKFYTIAVIFIFVIVAFFTDSLLNGYGDFLQNPESLAMSKYLTLIIGGTCIIVFSFFYILIQPTIQFLRYCNVKYSSYITIFFVLPISIIFAIWLGKTNIFPHFNLKSLIYVDKLCRETSEVLKFQEIMKKNNISILDFRQQCQEKTNEILRNAN